MSDESISAENAANDALAEAQQQVNALQGAVAQIAGEAAAEGGIDMLGDVELNVTVELGRTEMLVEDVLKLGSGSVVELDKLAGDPVDVFVNGRLIARGEVLVLNDNFCIRVSEIVAGIDEVDTGDSDDALLGQPGEPVETAG